MNLPLANQPSANRPPAYAELERRFHRWSALKDGRAVLDWDLAVMMPDGGAEARAEQIAALDVVSHGILADPDLYASNPGRFGETTAALALARDQQIAAEEQWLTLEMLREEIEAVEPKP